MPSLLSQGPAATNNAAGAAALIYTTRAYSKATTGIVGLPVDEHARQHLVQKLNEVLDGLKAVPADAEYRRSLEATIHTKLTALNSDAADAELETQFGRQLEQEIKLCKDELKLLTKMMEWAPWDVPAGHTVSNVCLHTTLHTYTFSHTSSNSNSYIYIQVEIIEEKDVEAKVGGGPAAPPPPTPPPPPPPK